MHDPASRRRVLKNIAAFGAAGTVPTAFANAEQRPQHFAQAQSDAPVRPSDPTASGGLPRIQFADRARYVAECRQGPDGPFAISSERNSSTEWPTTA